MASLCLSACCILLLFIGYAAGVCDHANNFENNIAVFDQNCDFSDFIVSYGKTRCCEEDTPPIEINYFESNPTTKPTCMYRDARPATFYTIVMVDPDAPTASNPIMSDWLHWGVSNIPGEALNGEEGTTGTDIGMYDVFMDYAPPTPPAGSGAHRYRFVVLEQKNELYDLPRYDERAKFNLKNLILAYDLMEKATATFTTEKLQ